MIRTKHLICAGSALAAFLMMTSCSSNPKKEDAAQVAKSSAPVAAAPASEAAKAKKKHAQKGDSKADLACQSGTDHRTAKIDTKGSGCQVEYLKFGETKVVASSAHGRQHCEDALAHIKKNLIASGFSCQ